MRTSHFRDGSAGDADYGTIGHDYARYRQPDPHIASRVLAALENAQSVLNVGAGAGSYEPRDRNVTAVEPSATMRAQRPPDLSPAIDAVAEDLPFPDQSFDAAMASSTVHQWHDLAKGISELVRVTRGPIVILASDPALLFDYWMASYLPEAFQVEAGRFPPIATLSRLLGPDPRVEKVDIPLNCTDGFAEAYYGRPERFLEPGVRGAMSSFTFVEQSIVGRAMERLAADLASGEWDRQHGHLRTQPFYDGSLRLIIRP
jgi:SAM-dependent methyltransferase